MCRGGGGGAEGRTYKIIKKTVKSLINGVDGVYRKGPAGGEV